MRAIETPAARMTDPESSHLAAKEVTQSGRRTLQRLTVADAVSQHPGSTARELAKASGINRYTVSRRLPDAELEGEVKRGESRRCGVGGRASLTWWPA